MRVVNWRVLISACLLLAVAGSFVFEHIHTAPSLWRAMLAGAAVSAGLEELVKAFSTKSLQPKKPTA